MEAWHTGADEASSARAFSSTLSTLQTTSRKQALKKENAARQMLSAPRRARR